MMDHDDPQAPGRGPHDRPERDATDPVGDNAYPGGSTLTPPTGDMDDPIPATGMPGEPELDRYPEEEGVGPEVDQRP
jgi:hypothetical protein